MFNVQKPAKIKLKIKNAFLIDEFRKKTFLRKGISCGLNQKYERSISYLTRIIEQDADNPTNFYNLALTQLLMNDIINAKNNFIKATILDPSFSLAYANLGQVYLRENDFENAILNLKKAISIDNANWSYNYELANIYCIAGDFYNALNFINKAIKIKPQKAILYQQRCQIYNNYLQFDEALKDINKAIKLDSNNSALYQSRGIIYISKGQAEKAIKSFTAAINLNNKDYLSYAHRAYAYLCLGSYRTVIDNCEQAIKIKPDFSAAYSYRATAKHCLGDKKGEKRDFHKSILFALKEKSYYSDTNICLCLYRPINKHTIKCLTENSLWFSHPDNFNDPLDTKFYKDIATEKSILDIFQDIRIRSLSFNNTKCNTLLWSHYSYNHSGIMIEYELNTN